jgi:hypothetical protein
VLFAYLVNVKENYAIAVELMSVGLHQETRDSGVSHSVKAKPMI